MEQDAVEVSLVVPMFNERHRVTQLCAALGRWEVPFGAGEIIFVDDGSSDNTVAILDANRWMVEAPQQLIRFPINRGKGAAVAAGIAAATGRYVAFLDADMAVGTRDLNRAVSLLLETGADIAVGNRRHVNSEVQTSPPWHRQVASRLFRDLVRILDLTYQPDTQCGFKVFRKEAAHEVFSCLTTRGFSFDVEILARAERLGLEMIDVPVHYQHREGSQIAPARDGLRMLRELWYLRRSLASWPRPAAS